MKNYRLKTLKTFGVSLGLALALAGCKAKPAVTDDALASTIQTALAADSAIAGQPVAVTVQNGIATLSGAVANDAQRTIAARDAAGVPGVKQVTNGLVVGAPDATNAMTAMTPAAPATVTPVAPEPVKPSAARAMELARDKQHERRIIATAPVERVPPPPPQSYNQPQQAYTPPPPAQPAAPPPPTYRTLTVQAGEAIPVRMTQTLDSATTQEGSTFSGVVASDILVDGVVAVSSGTAVSGQVTTVHEAGHFKGSSLLTVSLTTLTRRGERVSLNTEPYTLEGKGRGKNTLAKSGIGAAGGAILGGIFGGGKGAAIGAGVGGAGGAGINGVTRGDQVQIPSETIVRFRLADSVTVRVRTDAGGRDGDSNMQHR